MGLEVVICGGEGQGVGCPLVGRGGMVPWKLGANEDRKSRKIMVKEKIESSSLFRIFFGFISARLILATPCASGISYEKTNNRMHVEAGKSSNGKDHPVSVTTTSSW